MLDQHTRWNVSFWNYLELWVLRLFLFVHANMEFDPGVKIKKNNLKKCSSNNTVSEAYCGNRVTV